MLSCRCSLSIAGIFPLGRGIVFFAYYINVQNQLVTLYYGCYTSKHLENGKALTELTRARNAFVAKVAAKQHSQQGMETDDKN